MISLFKHTRTCRAALVACVVATMLWNNTAIAQRASEFQVKAAYLYNFTKFVEWPDSTLGAKNAPFVIGVLGRNPFNQFLQEIVGGERAFNRLIVVKYYENISDITNCHLLFINLPGKTNAALDVVKDKAVLTVSDDPAFCRFGGIIRFYTEDETVRLEINQKAAEAANVNISSKILRIAKICSTE